MNARQSILAFVKEYPGVHVREVERQLHLSSKLADYHLQALEDEGLVQRIAEKGYVRFVPSVTRPRWSARDVAFVCLMRRAVALRIVVLLLSREEMTHGELAKVLHLAKASTSYHLGLLKDAGIVTMRSEGRNHVFALADVPYVRGILADFTPLPEDLDPFTKVWDDLFG